MAEFHSISFQYTVSVIPRDDLNVTHENLFYLVVAVNNDNNDNDNKKKNNDF